MTPFEGMPDAVFERRVKALVDGLLGSDPERSREARDELLRLGGVSNPSIRSALESPRALPVSSRSRRSFVRPLSGRIGSHLLGECVGRGAFGLVFRITPLPGTTAPCCLKVANANGGGSGLVTRSEGEGSLDGVAADAACADGLRGGEALALDEETVSTLTLEEAMLLRVLEGDLLPEVHESGVEDGACWYAMRLFEGPSLRAYLRGKKLSTELIRPVARVCRELDALKDRSDFFHGDLKPDNLVLEGERLRAVDPARRGLGRTFTVSYNPMALEGEAADTCALALTLLEATSGQRPYARWTQPMVGARKADVQERRELLRLDLIEACDPLGEVLRAWIAEPPTYSEMDRTLRRMARG